MTTLVQVAPGVFFAAEVLNPKWGQSFLAAERPTKRHGIESGADHTQENHDQDVSREDRGEQMALL
ncbi:hypothetical protein F3J14_03975 [Burkholderia sp. Tr-862]|uniref:hypothetical protein n=1 Tax=Burkholderia sp. Tr-862 TaxID=2608331 RepID=UPI00141A2C9C|nr:hypothetical protein [Burkholderia sp. Tr-862]NIF40070.1 hypothetical protein [Burkholderia sp. Tr-862]